MKRVIYKYPIPFFPEQKLRLSQAAEVIHVGMQEGTITLWAMVDTDAPTENITIRIYGTGHEIDPNLVLYPLGTVFDGPYVWHVFEDITDETDYIESK